MNELGMGNDRYILIGLGNGSEGLPQGFCGSLPKASGQCHHGL